MKSIKKILFIMVALATALAFVSCSSEDDDPSTVAVYKGEDNGVTMTITFLDDNTWTVKAEAPGYSETVMSGTYTGDPSKDGKITIKGTMEGEEFEDEIEIANGKTDYFDGTFTRQ